MGQNQLKKPKKDMKESQGQQNASKIDKNGPKQAEKGQTTGKKLQFIKKEFNMPVKNRKLSKNQRKKYLTPILRELQFFA